MKIIKTMIIVFLIMSMTMTVSALETTVISSPEIIIGAYFGQQANGMDKWTVRTYPFNYQYEMNMYVTNNIADVTPRLYAGYFQSYIRPDTFYKMSIEVDVLNGESLMDKQGTIVPNNLEYFTIAQKETFANVDTTKIGQTQAINTPYTLGLISDDYYTMYYDKTSNMLTIVFYLPIEYFENHPEMMFHSYLIASLGTFDKDISVKMIVDEYTGAKIQGDYTEVLENIARTLENLEQSGSGGLTEEQINQAVYDAIESHDQQLQSEVQQQGTQADQLVDQLGDIVPAVKLQTALQGLTAAVSGNHRTCVLVLPEIVEPVTGGMIMQETPIDLTGTIQGIISSDSRIATLVDLVRWINLLVLAFSLLRSIMNIINYVTSGGDQGE